MRAAVQRSPPASSSSTPIPAGQRSARACCEAYEGAYRTDPISAYGGIIAFNRELDAATAAAIIERQFVEVLAAPALDTEAAAALAAQPQRARARARGAAGRDRPGARTAQRHRRPLRQTRDLADLDERALVIPTRRQPSAAELADLHFAWRVCKFVKSNAIVFARAGMTIGVGAGQMSRVYSTRIAAMKATDEKLSLAGAVMASDAFLPFRDNLDVAAGYGIRAVIQPGGSKRDAEVIAAADEHAMAMVFTGVRHFRH